ncbi:uncharacterized protein ACRADG_002322 [Cochliomyia hominivorax]
MNWNNQFLNGIIFILLILQGIQAKIVRKRGVMDNLNDGLKVAGQMFGINTAADVANLVAKAFSKTASNRQKPDLFSIIQKGLQLSPTSSNSNSEESRRNSEFKENNSQQEETTQFKQKSPNNSPPPSKESVGVNFGTTNLITSMLRMVGFDASKLGALAINALIMIASAIGNTLMGTTKSQPIISTLDGGRLFNRHPNKVNENPLEENAETGPEEQYAPNDHQPRSGAQDPTTVEWFLQNSSGKMKSILEQATHNNLADKLTEMIAIYVAEHGQQGACLKMLVCKSSPFIWGMQKSIRKYVDPKDEKAENIEDEISGNRLLNVKNFFTHLPSIDEYREYGEKCEKLYGMHCNTTDLYNK